MDDQQQHPPMNGDEELAKTLDGGLQFEETPAPGDGDMPAPTITPAPGATGAMGDPLAGMPTPSLPGDDEPKEDLPPEFPMPELPKPDEPAEEVVSDPEPGLPSVHHTHGKEEKEDDEPKVEEPVSSLPPVISPVHEEPEEHGKEAVHTGDKGLDKIKASALEELKPLVGKLSLSPDEKFDTLLLIIRSTDDDSLLEDAYKSAKDIKDENKRAQALLDIIKEVDYFSSKR